MLHVHATTRRRGGGGGGEGKAEQARKGEKNKVVSVIHMYAGGEVRLAFKIFMEAWCENAHMRTFWQISHMSSCIGLCVLQGFIHCTDHPGFQGV
jgi:hypothetical protein